MVVVELVVGGTTTVGVVSTTGGAVSTTGAGVVASTVLWYEKHPVAIPHAATTAGIITIRLIRRIFLESSIRYLPVTSARSRPKAIQELSWEDATKFDALFGNSFRIADFSV